MRGTREARFFVDENDLALAKGLALLRPDVVHPGHPNLPEIPLGSLDTEWLPIVGERRLLVITRDKKIRRRPGELLMWCSHSVRGFALTGTTSQNTWASATVIIRRWDDIERVTAERPQGPWLVSLTGGMREVDLRCPDV